MVSRLIPSNKLKWSTSQTPFFWSYARNESCTTTLKLHNINKKWSLPAANHAATTTTETNETSHASTLLELQLSCGAWCCTEKSFLMLHWNLTISFSFFFLQWCCPGEWPLATILSLHPATFAPWRHHLIFSLFLTPTCSSHLLSNILCLILLLKCLLM